MFRSTKPCFRLHKTSRLREAMGASGGRGWLFDLGSVFPGKAVGVTPAAFLLDGGGDRTGPRCAACVMRSSRRELCSRSENYGVRAGPLARGFRISQAQEKRRNRNSASSPNSAAATVVMTCLSNRSAATQLIAAFTTGRRTSSCADDRKLVEAARLVPAFNALACAQPSSLATNLPGGAARISFIDHDKSERRRTALSGRRHRSKSRNEVVKAARPQSLLPVSYLNSSHAPIRNDMKINATDRRAVRSQIMRISCVRADSSIALGGFESSRGA